MKIKFCVSIAAAAVAAFVLTGCGTEAHRIDASGNRGITTVDKLNFKDWQIAAEKCITSMLQSGALLRNDGRKSIIMISTVKNRTTQHLNTQFLTNKIRHAILRSGKALTTTAVSAKGAEDAATRQVRELQDDSMFNQATVQKDGTAIAPDFSLAGEIVQENTTEGRRREAYYFIHMTLTDLKTGLAVWEDNVEIAKQKKDALVGW